MIHCGLAKNSPPEADTRLCFYQLGVGSISKRGGEQFAFNMAKDYEDHCFTWLRLGHGVAYDGFRTHRLLAAEGGYVLTLGSALVRGPVLQKEAHLLPSAGGEVTRDRHGTTSLIISSLESTTPLYKRVLQLSGQAWNS